MHSFILLTASVAVLVLSANAETYDDKCYKKVVNCCYKYAACGYVPKVIPSSYGCDYKKCDDKCANVCNDVCKDVKKTIPKKVCVPKYKNVYHKYKDGCGYEVSQCSKAANGETCKTTYRYTTEKVCTPNCQKKCNKVCYTVKASCSKTKSVKYAKWCSALTCEKEAVVGDADKPGDEVSKTAIFVSESKPVRKIVGKH